MIDNNDFATFVIYDRVATLLLNKPCVDMIEAFDKVNMILNPMSGVLLVLLH